MCFSPLLKEDLSLKKLGQASGQEHNLIRLVSGSRSQESSKITFHRGH